MADRCDNCAEPLNGSYCTRCGQSTANFDLPVITLAKEFAGEALALDGRLRRTLGPLFLEPGSVARDYVAGHRARFVPPIRLYLFASFAMFLVVALGSGVRIENVEVSGGATSDAPAVGTDSTSGTFDVDLGGGALEGSLEARLAEGFQRIQEDREAFSREFLNRQAQSMFFMLPAFALLLKLAYRRRLYVHHLVFSIYLHSFLFLLVAVAAAPDALGLEAIGEWTQFMLLGVPVYLAVAMKRFYDERWGRTLVKFVAVSGVYGMIAAVVSLTVVVISVLSA